MIEEGETTQKMIRKKRTEINLSVEEIAEKLNMTVAKYLELENNKAQATIKESYLLSMGLHTNYSQEK